MTGYILFWQKNSNHVDLETYLMSKYYQCGEESLFNYV